jgi:tetratricopeptide (TPR) repeat protein
MKFDFLKTKVSVCIIGLIIGSAVGFKIANLQLRHEQGESRKKAVVEAAGRFSDPSNNQNMSPEQINNQVRAIIDKAKANPEDVEAQMEAAFQYIQIEQYQAAITILDQARKIAPRDVRPLLGLGVANMYMGRVDEAIGLGKQARQMEPKNPTVAMVLLSFYVESRKNLPEAEKLLGELESSGMDSQRLAELRGKLDAARSGGSNSGSGTGSRSTLDHGPRDQAPGGNR